MKTLALIALLTTACQTTQITAQPPKTFATLDTDKHAADAGVALRALSAKGVVFRVRTEAAKPQADLAFWREALQRKLDDDGYVIADHQDVTVGGHPGAMFLAVAPVGDADYAYLVAFAPLGDRVLIVESAGERRAFDQVKPDVIAALQTVQAPSGT